MVRYIFSQHNHFDADQLIDDMKRAGFRVSRATVYRTLAKLVDAGLLRRLEMGPRMYYEHDYGYPQHEHLHCEQCGKMIEFQSPAIEAAMQEVCRQHQFQASGHTFVIRGDLRRVQPGPRDQAATGFDLTQNQPPRRQERQEDGLWSSWRSWRLGG